MALAVGAGLAHELEALLDAEAVLLVDDDEAEVGEVDFFFDEGVGADGEVGFAAEDAARASRLVRRRASR